MWRTSFLPALAVAALAAASATSAPPPVRIAVLEGEEVRSGAEQAAAELNRAGGIAGRPVDLLWQAPSANPWRDGAGVMARLAFEDGVVALIGPADGAASHVAAQIATRNRVPLLSLAPEDSLTQAYVPWVFRGVPGDGRQAGAVLDALLPDPSGKAALLVVPSGREGRERLASLRAACADRRIRVGDVLGVESSASDPADVVLLWLDPGDAVAWLSKARADGLPARLGGSHRLDDPSFWSQVPPAAEGMVLPLLREPGQDGGSARRALGYDMVRALAAAVGSAEPTPHAVRQGLAGLQPMAGESGEFRFDGRGNRVGEIRLAEVRRGRPAPLGNGSMAGSAPGPVPDSTVSRGRR